MRVVTFLRNSFGRERITALFDGLYISGNQELCEQYMREYLEIFLSLKGVDGLSFENAKSKELLICFSLPQCP